MKFPILNCGGKSLTLSHTHVMGILNVTPDSFSDGGLLHRSGELSQSAILHRAEAMVAQGASIIDIGGESTRPGAESVSQQQELDRVLPAVEKISLELDVAVSVDTSSAVVMHEACRAGAGLINDVRALQREGALQAAAAAGVPVCLMHMQGQPSTMQQLPCYDDVVADVRDFFVERIQACVGAGVVRDNIVLDPGFGFGKTLPHNLALLQRLECFQSLGLPLLVGMSRKSMIANVLGERAIQERLPASLALAVMAVERGARIIRVHDVQATVDAVRMAEAVLAATVGQQNN